MVLKQNNQTKGFCEREGKKNTIFLILGLALLLRMILGMISKGYQSDIDCFLRWSDMVYKDGFSKFYSPETFTDYPPGYMYCLYFIAFLRNALKLEYYGPLSLLLIKLPAIVCDILSGYLVYKIAKEKFQEDGARLCSAIYVFNPAIIINSAIWGQVDSVFTLFVLLMCYLIVKERLPRAYFAFAIGILIKPQMLIFGPVLLFGIIDQVFIKGFHPKNFWKQLGWGILAIGLLLLLMVPFGADKVIHQYMDTLTSYPYASVNAYNIWTLFGLNWAPQGGRFLVFTYSQWGTLFLFTIVATAFLLSVRSKMDKSKYAVLGAYIMIGMFLFSVRMHERYMYPGLVLLLMAFVLRPRKELLVLYGLFSTVHLGNVGFVLWRYDNNNFNPKESFPIFISLITLLAFIYYIYILKKYYYNGEKESREEFRMPKIFQSKKLAGKGLMLSENGQKLSKFDIGAICIITLIYSLIALYDLGSHKAPANQWEASETGTSIVIDFGQQVEMNKIAYFLGNYEDRIFTLESSENMEGPWNFVSDFTMESVFAWGECPIQTKTRFLRLTSKSEKAVVREMVFLNSKGKVVTPKGFTKGEALFDEQQLYPQRSTFRDSTYFDEIYHARTAYEYLHGLYSYENTHPPFGKIMIALGMMIFGVNPFGWRIMGTLFGIAMVPLLYVFGKKFFKESWIATVTTVLFAFDFMHFTQTRIATIDVFVTFFIILMYFFMYWYTQMSFFDTELKKTFIPLGLCGISMGFAVASKWTGAYAGVGLAIIFFYTLFCRYREYQYALNTPDGHTGAVEHKYVIEHFREKSLKTLMFCVIFFVIIPFFIYLLSYIPFEDAYGRGLLARMIKNQETMFQYHSNIDAEHAYSSWWYQWPTIYRPIWYYSGHITANISEGISAFGNPLVWWAGIPAFFYMIYLSIFKGDKRAKFLVISYMAQYLPWFLVTRITFIYHYFPSVPFVTLMVGYGMYQLAGKNKKRQKLVVLYAASAVVLFVMFYPVLSGQPVNKEFVFRFLRWFDTWVLVT